MIKIIEKHPIAAICILVALMMLPNLHVMQVTIMEARNFISAREMITDNHWLLTTMNGEARYQKPPLPTWLSAISAAVFGLNVFALRLPTVFMIMVIGVYIYKLSFVILKNNVHSLVNACIAFTSFYIVGITIEAPWDIYAHGFMTIAIYHFYLLFQKENKYWKHTLIAGICLGLSFLSKGPVSLYALFLPFLLAYSFTYKFKTFRPKTFSIFSALILMIGIGGWWFIYVRYMDPETFTHITTKETSNWGSYNIRPFYYYWSFFTQSGIWTIPAFIGLLFPYLKSRVRNLKAYKFSFYWTIFAVILLSVIPEKKSRYLMPVLIPLAINTGFYIDYLFQRFRTLQNKKETFPVYFNFGLIATIGLAFPIIAYLGLKDNLNGFWIQYGLASIVLLTLGVFIFINLKNKAIKNVFFLTVLFFAAIFVVGLPLYKSMVPSHYSDIKQLHTAVTEKEMSLYGINYVAPEMIWMYGDIVPYIEKTNNQFQFPKANRFGLLAHDLTDADKQIISSHYTMEYVRTYDINMSDASSSKHNSRLVNEYYILTKK
ncbi:glycosyltransferase (GTnc) [Formosa agariphila KMM 3901]|uniref:Glycosyltransferase (GTnc) n=1 Tax=Formosa agariphila (strain DSM 15362 / KCTC 12365 / LMG 23005 / KMM 3901 / M-2Alg 35-1) TaxID=1347342 RepID=T2KJD1_FORAG|nr:glycosyltransferase family 39 protein [Formosa agariphila]CDF78543.1 glycosyltransferase (GTnc) [Formosa agariphila KMM 3901]